MVSTPKAPDPTATAQAQSEYNTNTAISQQLLNMTNQNTPYGSVSYNQTGTNTFTGADGKTYSLPQFTQTTTLNPEQQSTLNYTQGAANNIAQTAQSLSNSGLSNLSQPVDTSGAPVLQSSLGSSYSTSPGSNYSSSLGSGYQTGLGSDYQTSFGGDVSQAYNDAKSAVMDQLTPTLDRNSEQSRAQMIASGIRPGTAAYSANEQTIGDNYTRAANQATETAQSVQNQLFNQQQQQAQFTNQSLLDQGNFTDQALASQMQLQNQAALQGQGFSNDAALQQAQFGNAANSQWLQNYYTQRDQPLNELGALLSGSQVTNANSATSATPQTQVGGVDYSGMVEQNYQNQLAQSQGVMSGLFGLGSSALGATGSYFGRK